MTQPTASVVQALFEVMSDRAEGEFVDTVTIGLGYTAVRLAGGAVGLSYTMAKGWSESVQRKDRDLDGSEARAVLPMVFSDDTLERSIGMALVNALNHRRASRMPEDSAPGGELSTFLGLTNGSRISMVGYFPPVAARFEEAGAEVRVLDRDRLMGVESEFLDALEQWPDVLVVTAATLLNGSFERFADVLTPAARIVVLGPTTPMVPEAFAPYPIAMLGGMVVRTAEPVISAVRQAALTPALQQYCRKVYWTPADS